MTCHRENGIRDLAIAANDDFAGSNDGALGLHAAASALDRSWCKMPATSVITAV